MTNDIELKTRLASVENKVDEIVGEVSNPMGNEFQTSPENTDGIGLLTPESPVRLPWNIRNDTETLSNNSCHYRLNVALGSVRNAKTNQNLDWYLFGVPEVGIRADQEPAYIDSETNLQTIRVTSIPADGITRYLCAALSTDLQGTYTLAWESTPFGEWYRAIARVECVRSGAPIVTQMESGVVTLDELWDVMPYDIRVNDSSDGVQVYLGRSNHVLKVNMDWVMLDNVVGSDGWTTGSFTNDVYLVVYWSRTNERWQAALSDTPYSYSTAVDNRLIGKVSCNQAIVSFKQIRHGGQHFYFAEGEGLDIERGDYGKYLQLRDFYNGNSNGGPNYDDHLLVRRPIDSSPDYMLEYAPYSNVLADIQNLIEQYIGSSDFRAILIGYLDDVYQRLVSTDTTVDGNDTDSYFGIKKTQDGKEWSSIGGVGFVAGVEAVLRNHGLIE